MPKKYSSKNSFSLVNRYKFFFNFVAFKEIKITYIYSFRTLELDRKPDVQIDRLHTESSHRKNI